VLGGPSRCICVSFDEGVTAGIVHELAVVVLAVCGAIAGAVGGADEKLWSTRRKNLKSVVAAAGAAIVVAH